MRRALCFLFFLFFSAFCFAQQKSNLRVFGKIPDASDNRKYQIQVGAFTLFQNAEKSFKRLKNASLNPDYESFSRYARVVINGVAAKDVPSYLQRIEKIGFNEVIIRIYNGTDEQTPVCPEVKEEKTPEPPAPDPLDPEPEPEPEPEPAPVKEVILIEETTLGQQLLPAPEYMHPENSYIVEDRGLRQQRNINFSWNAVEGAASYVLTIYRETPQGRRQIFASDPIEQTHYTFVNLELLENTGTYVWRVDALSYNSHDNTYQRGEPGENTFSTNVPRPGQVKTKDTGVQYGN